jgi:hypothetical protein
MCIADESLSRRFGGLCSAARAPVRLPYRSIYCPRGKYSYRGPLVCHGIAADQALVHVSRPTLVPQTEQRGRSVELMRRYLQIRKRNAFPPHW